MRVFYDDNGNIIAAVPDTASRLDIAELPAGFSTDTYRVAGRGAKAALTAQPRRARPVRQRGALGAGGRRADGSPASADRLGRASRGADREVDRVLRRLRRLPDEVRSEVLQQIADAGTQPSEGRQTP